MGAAMQLPHGVPVPPPSTAAPATFVVAQSSQLASGASLERVASVPPSAVPPPSGWRPPPSPLAPPPHEAGPGAPFAVITIVCVVAGIGMEISDGKGNVFETPRALNARLALTLSVPLVARLPR